MNDDLATVIDAELRRPVAPVVAALAARLAARTGNGAQAVVFYGSALRDDTLDGVLDFYVLVDRPADVGRDSRWLALAGRVLPPNVGYLECDVDGQRLRAKVAWLTMAQFGAAMSTRRIDTTSWARFSQPCACAWARGDAERDVLCDAICAAVATAARWAAWLGPVQGAALDFWRALYRRTYAAELRVESRVRAFDLVARDEARYAELLPAAWRTIGIAFARGEDGRLEPKVDAIERAAAERRWRLRQRLGRPLNVLRLLKAAWTFENAIDYVAWKVERHSGYRIEPSAFQRRHPLLAAPGLYRRLRGLGVLR